MPVVHDPEGRSRTIATTVDRAETMLEQSRGLMFRRSVPEDYALVFPFDRVGRRFIHMLFVRFPLDVIWLADETVRRASTLRPWRSMGYAKADTVLELPAGAADGVETGDTVVVE
ncbi:DUF192 domain-containing protein [Haloarcula nitratireducens]|uniref:DUF192 domain-containing protein n=1 Tax=Haloarcula nitratireducens TaxID=2487749 RepID=A0AAW4P5S7_9EURY|nr:DUF192 domain-containing protein [Halomicroarcula nitratireducens]MBX0293295.1 DUF192 domain-containing protein [Halomicroarcula nitratireducens]